MSGITSTEPTGSDSTRGFPDTLASKLRNLPALDDDLPTPDTSTTLSRLTPLDLALKSSLSVPRPSSPDVTTETASTAQKLQHLRGLLINRPNPYYALTPQQLEAKTFRWLVLDLTYQETLERLIEKLDFLCDQQILSTLWKGSERDREIIIKDIEKRKAAYRSRTEKSLEEAAIDKARGMKVEVEGWDDEEAQQKLVETVLANVGEGSE